MLLVNIRGPIKKAKGLRCTGWSEGLKLDHLSCYGVLSWLPLSSTAYLDNIGILSPHRSSLRVCVFVLRSRLIGQSDYVHFSAFAGVNPFLGPGMVMANAPARGITHRRWLP